MTLVAGEKVKPFSFGDHAGREHKYPEDFAEAKLALFLMRHLGCPLCQLKIAELKEAFPLFAEKGVMVAAVVQSTPRRVADYASKNGLPFLLVPDPEKTLYRHFEIPGGGLKEFLAPAVLKASIRATLKGYRHGAFEGNEFQIPASFLLTPQTEILYAYYGKNISDFGSVAELLGRL